jgi:hypothetical protein
MNLYVSNAVSSSVYTWTTSDGNIVSDPVNDTIIVDGAGTYVVSQQLQAFCPTYATDTVVVSPFDPSCSVLKTAITNFSAWLNGDKTQLNWSVVNNNEIRFFDIESSVDGINFAFVQSVKAKTSDFPDVDYTYIDNNSLLAAATVFYRLKIINLAGEVSYSQVIRVSTNEKLNGRVKIFPNPVSDNVNVSIYTPAKQEIQLAIYDATGRLMKNIHASVEKGTAQLNISDFQSWPAGIYSVKVIAGKELFIKKMILKK